MPAKPGARTLLTGSHYDTVINGGKYDGRLGILVGLAVIEHLHRTGRQLPFGLELIGFAEEEGLRFSASYIGSAAIAGNFDHNLLARRDGSAAARVGAGRGSAVRVTITT